MRNEISKETAFTLIGLCALLVIVQSKAEAFLQIAGAVAITLVVVIALSIE